MLAVEMYTSFMIIMGKYGSSSCYLNKWQRCDVHGREFLDTTKESPVSFDRSSFYPTSLHASFVKNEYMLGVDLLMTVKRGQYQDNIVKRFLKKSAWKNLHRICRFQNVILIADISFSIYPNPSSLGCCVVKIREPTWSYNSLWPDVFSTCIVLRAFRLMGGGEAPPVSIRARAAVHAGESRPQTSSSRSRKVVEECDTYTAVTLNNYAPGLRHCAHAYFTRFCNNNNILADNFGKQMQPNCL